MQLLVFIPREAWALPSLPRAYGLSGYLSARSISVPPLTLDRCLREYLKGATLRAFKDEPSVLQNLSVFYSKFHHKHYNLTRPMENGRT